MCEPRVLGSHSPWRSARFSTSQGFYFTRLTDCGLHRLPCHTRPLFPSRFQGRSNPVNFAVIRDFRINASWGSAGLPAGVFARKQAVSSFCGLAGKSPSWVDLGKEGTKLRPGEGLADTKGCRGTVLGSAGPAEAWAATGSWPEKTPDAPARLLGQGPGWPLSAPYSYQPWAKHPQRKGEPGSLGYKADRTGHEAQ